MNEVNCVWHIFDRDCVSCDATQLFLTMAYQWLFFLSHNRLSWVYLVVFRCPRFTTDTTIWSMCITPLSDTPAGYFVWPPVYKLHSDSPTHSLPSIGELASSLTHHPRVLIPTLMVILQMKQNGNHLKWNQLKIMCWVHLCQFFVIVHFLRKSPFDYIVFYSIMLCSIP